MSKEEQLDHVRRIIAGDLAVRVCNHHLNPETIRAVLEDHESLIGEFDRLSPPRRSGAAAHIPRTRVHTHRLPHPSLSS